MIQYIRTVYREWLTSFNTMMFNLGYMVTALVVGSYYYIRAIVASLKLKDRESYDEYADGLLEKGDKSFELFLNQLCIYIPDNWRRHIVYNAGDW